MNLTQMTIISTTADRNPSEEMEWPSWSTSTNAKEAEEFYEDLRDLLELTPKKDVIFIIEDWNAKVGSQEILE